MSTKITGNEPAMPTANSDRGIDFGLTIRQHYAGIIMQGMVANPSLMEAVTSSELIVGNASERVAEISVKYADKLIEELNKD